ncbi:MAG: GTPase Era [Proteobacteria bacterium]|nr:GTPase Era [Burkholderiales bacterium]
MPGDGLPAAPAVPPLPARAGRIAIVGRPNVGKSTLLNRLIGRKLAIVSGRAQTTRSNLLGILTRDDAQFGFVDTPGLQDNRSGHASRTYNREVIQALDSVDAVAWVVEAGRFRAEDQAVGRALPKEMPVVLVINKIDQLSDKRLLLPFIDRVRREREFAAIVPVSAERDAAFDPLLDALALHLPEQTHLYDADALTDRGERYFAGEIVREKLFRFLGAELPYACDVSIDQFEELPALRRIYATISVLKAGQKAIVIGERGAQLKAIGSAARQDMESLFDCKVFLELWVKVQRTRARSKPGSDAGVSDDERR